MNRNINALLIKEEIGEEKDKIKEIYRERCLLQKDENWNKMNEERLALMKNEMSRHHFKDFICYDTGCKEKCGPKFVDGSVFFFARLNACIVTVIAFLL